ncbi:hypothetical protein [Sphingomonas sp. 1P08PE]|uniref:hypothetical protein n=1 Tax=Sphingomonas sp. 1P08PE TaxID=554122 RepID=UPI0039A000F2
MSETVPSSRAACGIAMRLVPAAMVITFVSLSVHVVMLQVLHIAYPDMSGVGRLGLVLVALRVFSLLVVYRLAYPVLGPLPVIGRVAAVALLDTAVAGNVRAAVMDAVVTNGSTFPAVKLVSELSQSLVLAILIEVSRRLIRRPIGLLAATLVITGVTTFLVAPAARAAIAPFANLRRPEIYTEPYGVYVLSWSYATFLETTVAVLTIAALVGRRLSPVPVIGVLQFATLVLLLRGTLVMQLLFPWSMRPGVSEAMLSTAQFFLQDLVLAVLAWLAWWRSDGGASPPPCAA